MHLATCHDSVCHETENGARHMHDSQFHSERPLHDTGVEGIAWSSQANYTRLPAQLHGRYWEVSCWKRHVVFHRQMSPNIDRQVSLRIVPAESVVACLQCVSDLDDSSARTLCTIRVSGGSRTPVATVACRGVVPAVASLVSGSLYQHCSALCPKTHWAAR